MALSAKSPVILASPDAYRFDHRQQRDSQHHGRRIGRGTQISAIIATVSTRFKNRRHLLTAARRVMLLVIWPLAVVLAVVDWLWLKRTAEFLFVALLVVLLRQARRDTLIVATILIAASVALLAGDAKLSSLALGLDRALLFSALLPTLALIRATAQQADAIRLSQTRIADLPPSAANLGILLGAQAFGSVLNAGAFALTINLTADDAPRKRRRSDALAALRGMNIAVFWSPFFVGFAVANTYLPSVPLWQIMPLGLFMTATALAWILLAWQRPFSTHALRAATKSLKPLTGPLLLTGSVVIVGASIFGLSTLTAILLLMPGVCLGYLLTRPRRLVPALTQTHQAIGHFGDDLLIIAGAMLLGSVASASPALAEWLTPLLRHADESFCLLLTVVGTMTLAGIIGIHPMITGTVLLVSLDRIALPVSDLILMEAVLIGWALGTMSSLTSLSVVSVAALYRLRPLELALSKNLIFVLFFAPIAAWILTVVNDLPGG